MAPVELPDRQQVHRRSQQTRPTGHGHGVEQNARRLQASETNPLEQPQMSGVPKTNDCGSAPEVTRERIGPRQKRRQHDKSRDRPRNSDIE